MEYMFFPPGGMPAPVCFWVISGGEWAYRVGRPERDFCPRMPKPQVAPCPAEIPRPFLVFAFCEPGAGERLPRMPNSPATALPTVGSATRASRRCQSKTFIESAERAPWARDRGAASTEAENLLDAARPKKALLPAMGAMKALLTAREPIARTAMITMALRIFPTHEAAAARSLGVIGELANARCKASDRRPTHFFFEFDQLLVLKLQAVFEF